MTGRPGSLATSSFDGAAPAATRWAAKEAIIAPLSVHSRGRGIRSVSPAARTAFYNLEVVRAAQTLGTLGRADITWLALLSQQSQTDRFITTADTLKPLYAWIRKDLGDGWSTTVGLQNVPWDLQSDFFGSSRLSTGDYSIFNYRFGAGKQTGVTLKHQGDDLRVTTGVFSQVSDRLNGWNDPAALSFAVSTRAELKFGADWAQLDWFSLGLCLLAAVALLRIHLGILATLALCGAIGALWRLAL